MAPFTCPHAESRRVLQGQTQTRSSAVSWALQASGDNARARHAGQYRHSSNEPTAPTASTDPSQNLRRSLSDEAPCTGRSHRRMGRNSHQGVTQGGREHLDRHPRCQLNKPIPPASSSALPKRGLGIADPHDALATARLAMLLNCGESILELGNSPEFLQRAISHATCHFSRLPRFRSHSRTSETYSVHSFRKRGRPSSQPLLTLSPRRGCFPCRPPRDRFALWK